MEVSANDHFYSLSDHYSFNGYQVRKLLAWQVLVGVMGFVFFVTCYFLDSPSDHSVLAVIIACSAGGTPHNASSSLNSARDRQAVECTSPACITQAYITKQLMNFSADPCENFYEHACGNLRELTYTISEYTWPQSLQEWMLGRNLDALFGALLSGPPAPSYSALSKARKLYASCMNGMRSAQKKDILQDLFITRLDGNLEFTTSWNDSDWNFDDVFIDLSVEPAANTLLTFTWRPPIKKGDRNILVIAPGQTYLPTLFKFTSKPYAITEMYINLVKKVMLNLAKDTFIDYDGIEKDIDIFAKEVVNFETEFVKVDAWPGNGQEHLDQLSTVAELKTLAPSFDWYSILERLIDSNLLNDSTPVWIEHPSHLIMLNSLVDASLKRVLSHVLSWGYIMNYITAMGIHYTSDFLDFVSLHEEQLGLPHDIRGQCRLLVEEVMPHALNYVFLVHHLNQTDTSAMSNFSREQHSLTKNSLPKWMTSTYLQTFWKTRPDPLKADAQMLSWSTDTSKLDEYYRQFKPNDLIQDNAQQAKEFSRWLLRERLRYKNDIDPKTPRTWETRIRVDKTLTLITTPMGAMAPPLYGFGLPEYVNNAGLGSLIIENTVGALLWPDYNHPGQRVESPDSTTGSRLAAYEACILKSYQNQSVDLPKTSFPKGVYDPKPMKAEDDKNGLKRLHYTLELAYQQHSANRQLAPALPSFEYTSSDQSFFIAFAQARCEDRVKQHQDFFRSRKVPIKNRINGAFYGSSRFREAFKCKTVPKQFSTSTCSLLQQ